MNRIAAGIAALGLFAVLAGCGGSSSPSSKTSKAAASIDVHGTVVLKDLASARAAALGGANKTTPGCKGLGAYDDVTPGGSVSISNDGGSTLSIAKLAGGFVADDNATMCRSPVSAAMSHARTC